MENIEYNEYQIKMLLMRGDIDFTKFYKIELIDFLKVASKEIKTLKEQVNLQIKSSETTNDLANEYYKIIQNAIDYIKNTEIYNEDGGKGWLCELDYFDELLRILGETKHEIKR